MPTFVAMSSRNRWVAISTNGLLSGIRDSDAISAVSLDPRAAHDERVDALVVPQEGTHVVLVDVHLGHVLRGDLRLPAPSAGGEGKQASEFPDTEMFFAISSRNRSWKTQKLHTAMSWTFSLYSFVTVLSAGLIRPTANRVRKIVGT